jgi:hypothetical protein
MTVDLQFGLYEEDGRGRMWRASFADLAEAKRRAQELVKDEGKEFVVYNLNSCREVARICPAETEPSPRTTEQNRHEGIGTR